mmetsp:Transcript_13451/g.28188  ORF Transcript_13451/g.28188 Transcript_13451/m.28188 type:complete len:348 (-) Transcript_13451:2575-3618(-)|eukprot:CAMPEP_0168192896 /NCGR_PEP_ID=MMETSP0139_2-20121125/18297_1 /TAXON_ID=44445 /ORGANISM="Pseudo-nitzschia australis, Strain 10249 10 AB" /LENGTH=347 /DNA_ID=CAMNT_0008116175 /DNA_START=147 /DNA_END=1190 /DNA_ORIENTATION=+
MVDRDEDEQSEGGEDEDNMEVCQGLTDEYRREIRKKQRCLRKEMDDLDVDEARDKNNELNKKVKYVREAVLDAENIDEIAKKAAKKIDQLIQVPRYDADRVVSKLIEQCRITRGGHSYFDWKGLGDQAGVCFNAIPSQVSFLNGPLVDGKEEVNVKQRAKRIRNTQPESDAEEERPEDIKGHTARGANQLSAVKENIENVKIALKRKVDSTYFARKKAMIETYGGEDKIPERIKKKIKRNRDVNAIELLFNPKSFTQTVENLYHYSFLVKDGTATLDVRENKVLDKDSGVHLEGGPVVKYIVKRNDPPPPRQAIVNLTMEDWKNLCDAYEVKSSGVPHREGGEKESS